jgi:hypothetical protein
MLEKQNIVKIEEETRDVAWATCRPFFEKNKLK